MTEDALFEIEPSHVTVGSVVVVHTIFGDETGIVAGIAEGIAQCRLIRGDTIYIAVTRLNEVFS